MRTTLFRTLFRPPEEEHDITPIVDENRRPSYLASPEDLPASEQQSLEDQGADEIAVLIQGIYSSMATFDFLSLDMDQSEETSESDAQPLLFAKPKGETLI